MDNFRDFDKLKTGDLVTSLYIECIRKDGVIIIERNGIGKEYSLKPRPDLTSSNSNVHKIDVDDSEVFELVNLFEYQILNNQTNKEQYSKILDSFGENVQATMGS